MKKIKMPDGKKIYCVDRLTALYIYDEIFQSNDYLKHGINIQNGDTVFDVGANIGLFTLYITEKFQDLNIYAFEPIPDIFETLKKNLSNNPHTIKTYNLGLSHKTGEQVFHFFPNASALSAMTIEDRKKKQDLYLKNYDDAASPIIPFAKYVPQKWRPFILNWRFNQLYKTRTISCQLSTLSRIIKEEKIKKIDLLKIDAENCEKQVLAGIQDDDWDKINQISMEVHGQIKGGENLLNELSQLLKAKGFKVYYDDEDVKAKMAIYMLYAVK